MALTVPAKWDNMHIFVYLLRIRKLLLCRLPFKCPLSADSLDAMQGETSRFLPHSPHLLHCGQTITVHSFSPEMLASKYHFHTCVTVTVLQPPTHPIPLSDKESVTFQVLCSLLLVNILAILWASKRVTLPGLK